MTRQRSSHPTGRQCRAQPMLSVAGEIVSSTVCYRTARRRLCFQLTRRPSLGIAARAIDETARLHQSSTRIQSSPPMIARWVSSPSRFALPSRVSPNPHSVREQTAKNQATIQRCIPLSADFRQAPEVFLSQLQRYCCRTRAPSSAAFQPASPGGRGSAGAVGRSTGPRQAN